MNKYVGLFVLMLLSVSCSSDLDFSQTKAFKSEPVVVANLASFDFNANQFVISGVELPFLENKLEFGIFNDRKVNTNLRKTDFIFEFTNTINRRFAIKLDFLDASNVTLNTIFFDVPASTGKPIFVSKTAIFENANLDTLRQTLYLSFAVALLPGPPLTNASVGSLKLRSSGTLYFLYQ
jgi:hypothetical protein